MTHLEKIIREYKKISSGILAITTLFSTIAYKFIYPVINAKYKDNPLMVDLSNFLLNLSFIYTGFFLLVFIIYENFFWLLLNRKNYFAGYWKGYVTYTVCERQSAFKDATKLELPHKFEVFFRIQQTPFKLEIVQGRTPRLGAKWTASNVEIKGNSEFSFFYEADGSKEINSEYPPHIERREKLSSILFHNIFGYPIKLKGQIRHLALSGISLYSGECEYQKISRKEGVELMKRI